MKYKLKYTGKQIDELLDKVATGEAGSGSSTLEEDLIVTTSVGGIQQGTTYAKGTSITKILKDMLAPVIIVKGKMFAFVSNDKITNIPNDVTSQDVPTDFATNGVTLDYVTQNIQYEYFAYPASFGTLKSIIQNGSFEVKDVWELVNKVTIDSVEYNLYRTMDGQADDESNYKFIPGGSN